MNLFSGIKATILGQSGFPWDNRRQHQRLRLRLPVGAGQGHRQAVGEMLDLSAHGIRISSSLPARPKENLCLWPAAEVALVGRQRVPCRVAWCRAQMGRYQVGLTWTDPDSWIQELWRRVQPTWAQPAGWSRSRRRHLRVLCQLDVKLTVLDEPQSWHGLCHDLSPGGCRLQVQAHLNAGQFVRLDFAALTLEGRVVGREGTSYHVRFGPHPCPRVRGLLLNLLQAQAPLCEDPLVGEEILPPPGPTPTLPLPKPRPLSCVPVPRLPEFPKKSGLPEAQPPLHPRELLPDRNPSLWAARLLPLRNLL